MKQAPDILLIMVDQLTPFALPSYGNETVISPAIDQLAEEGVQFDAAYCNSPLCVPARIAFMTGQYISRSGGYDNASYFPSTIPTFAHYLRAMGYRTALSGKMHFVGPDQLHGFEERYTTDIHPADFGWVPNWRDPDKRIDDWFHNMSGVIQSGVGAISNQLTFDDEVGANAVQALYDNARTADERPFCLVASFVHPHDPYVARLPYWEMYEGVDIPLPRVKRPPEGKNDAYSLRLEKAIALDAVDISDDDIIRARRAYYANISYVDTWVRRLLDALEETGRKDNTVVVFTSDHGEMLGERGLWYKMHLLEWSARVPLIVHNPQLFKPARVKNPVSHVDLLPTLCSVAALGAGEVPAFADQVDGRDILPLCRDPNDPSDPDMAMCEYLAEATTAPILMVRKGSHKYISCATDPELLYDLESDPDELSNLAGDPGHKAVLEELRAVAAAHWDSDKLAERIIRDQDKRRFLYKTLCRGRLAPWDYQVRRDASQEYARSHMNLTQVDIDSRYPRPEPFNPKWT